MDNNLLRFQYASILARSPLETDRREATLHLEYLISNDIKYLRDSLYILATLRFILHEYELARTCAEELLRIDPDNEQVSNRFFFLWVCWL
jgi:tetratricopeptide (TPR) repeat protein